MGMLAFPYVFLAVVHPSQMAYTGMIFSPADNIVYTTQMLHAAMGDWLWHDYFTHLLVSPRPIYFFYTLLGKLQPPIDGPVAPAILQQVARLACALLFLHQAWRFFADVLPDRAVRRVAFLFLAFTSGLGVFVLLTPLAAWQPPFDLVYPNSSAFFGLMYPPHFAAILLLFVVYLRCLWRATSKGRRSWAFALGAGLAGAGVSLIHPDTAVALGVAAAAYTAWAVMGRAGSTQERVGTGARGALAIAGAVPYTVYILVAVALGHDTVLAAGQAQGSPPELQAPVLYYLLGLGLPALCALAALPRAVAAIRRGRGGAVLLWSVVVGELLVLSTPFGRQGHGGEGLWVVLSPLAATGLVRVLLPRLWRSPVFARLVRLRPLGYSRRRLRILSINLVLILAMPSILALTVASPRAALANAGEIYLTEEDAAAVSWIRHHVAPGEVIVAAPESAQFAAAYGGARVAFGTKYYTPDYDTEAARLLAFFKDRDRTRAYLAEHDVGWVYFGPRERALAAFDPDTLPYLSPAFRAGDTAVYRVAR
jgi:hypothetical protein